LSGRRSRWPDSGRICSEQGL